MSEDVSIRLATPDDAHLPSFDNTKLTAINTCPTWGILRYDMHKAMPGAGRAMALEAGAACHEVFAAARMFDLRVAFGPQFDYHMPKLFGEARTHQMMNVLNKYAHEDRRIQKMNFALTALETSGYYDDPRDKRRTLANMEETCIAYMDRITADRPVWVRDGNDPRSDIGVEIKFDLVIEWHNDIAVRFTGRIDGLHWTNATYSVLEAQENKTASRLDDAWSQSFIMAHQVTGYCVAASTFSGESVMRGRVLGTAIPLPRTYDYGGIVELPVYRYDHQIEEWLAWFRHTIEIWEQNKDDVIRAPKYTHSCNRYYRPCSFIPFCGVSPDERVQVIEDMQDDEWSPLDDAD